MEVLEDLRRLTYPALRSIHHCPPRLAGISQLPDHAGRWPIDEGKSNNGRE